MKRIIVTVAAALVAVSAFAQTEVLTFSRIERNPRSSALAGSGAASVSNVAYASFTNAAIVPFYEGTLDVGAGYQYWAPSLGAANAVNLGASYKFGRVGVTVGGVYQMEKLFDGFRPYELQLNAGAGVRILKWLGVGVNARFVSEALYQGKTITGFGMDAMAIFLPAKGLSLTAGISNFGTPVKSSTEMLYDQPVAIRLAAAYLLPFAGKHSVEFMLDEDYYLSSEANAVSAAAEYSFNKMIYARAGYRYASKKAAYGSHLGLGLGFQFKGIRLDVSYITASDVIGNSITAGVGYRF